MIGFCFRRKVISKVLVLVYLLVGSGMGNALLWCQESEAFTHLEYNLSGSCQNTCDIKQKVINSGSETVPFTVVKSDSADCLDSPVSLSHTPSDKIKTSLDGEAFSWDVSPPPAKNLSSIAVLTNLNLSAQPPPSLSLVTLRTVVLLN